MVKMQSSSTNVKISYFDKNKVLPHYESVKNTDAFYPQWKEAYQNHPIKAIQQGLCYNFDVKRNTASH